MSGIAPELLDAALAYAGRGWPVVPLHTPASGACSCAKPKCQSPAKHPRTEHGLKDASTDPVTIRGWWTRWPDANVGLVTGVAFDVVDLDGEDGIQAFLELAEQHDESADDLPRVATGGGGRHLLLAPTGSGNRAGILPHVDWRGRGGYIVAPPSRHISGNVYAWKQAPNGHIPVAPSWLRDLATRRRSQRVTAAPAEGYGRRALAEELAALEAAPQGTRNSTLNSGAFALFQLVAGGELGEAEVTAALTDAARRIGLEDPEIQGTLRSAREAGFREPRTAPRTTAAGRAASEGGGFELNDTGNARRFVIQHGTDVRFVVNRGDWLVYDGRRWHSDDNNVVVTRRTGTVAAAIDKDAAGVEDEKQRKALARWAVTSGDEPRRRRMLELARSAVEVGVRSEELDRDPWLLGVRNGTVDLRTGALRPHRREDLITRQAPVRFDPHARSPRLEAFLERVLPDAGLREYVQRAVGYSLTGLTTAEAWFLAYGPPASGKSTLLEALRRTLGDYASTISTDAFTRQRDSGARPEIARLDGVRLATASEVSSGRSIDEALVKTLTGGDTVVARELYRQPVAFHPKVKLWVAANDRPRIRDDDEAMWRRVVELPFSVSIPEAERDPEVKAELLDVDVSGAALLAWAVRGCLAWRASGLTPPAAVVEATRAYRAEMDDVGGFLDECCGRHTEAWTSSERLYAAFTSWAGAQGIARPVTARGFGKRLSRYGLTAEKGSTDSRGWRGVYLLERLPGSHG